MHFSLILFYGVIGDKPFQQVSDRWFLFPLGDSLFQLCQKGTVPHMKFKNFVREQSTEINQSKLMIYRTNILSFAAPLICFNRQKPATHYYYT
jgi:hypothetical protein